MLPYATIRAALEAQPLFEAKSWQLAPAAWPLTPEQAAELEQIGQACLEFHQALETLYLRSHAGKNLLRNKPLLAPWVAEYLDRGKPVGLLAHAREARQRGALPVVLRPDLLLTDDGWAMTELDSVPGGIGLTAFLNRLYAQEVPSTKGHVSGGPETSRAGVVASTSSAQPQPTSGASFASVAPAAGEILGGGDAMLEGFHAALAALAVGKERPTIAIVVSEEAATYRPEMEWLAAQLQQQGRRVYCLRPEQVFPLGGAVFFDLEGTPEKIDVVYRFFELFDLPNVACTTHLLEAWAGGEVAIAPPLRPFQEEKLALALFHHHLLQDFWAENLSRASLRILLGLIPASWAIDPSPLPPSAVLDAPQVGGRPIYDWRQLAGASQKERDLIIKISGYHETAWGARSVTLGSDCSREEWQSAVDAALALGGTHLHLLQRYRKPRRERHPLYDAHGQAHSREGRLRLCPYFFVVNGRTRLGGALATFCPPDKKIIHGMQDAAMLPCRVAPRAPAASAPVP
ncbi:MAG: hypothetical protein IPL39_15620 [Opitutaceae bacterium]|nr:hypothetical protein [Opitutaceae bacterium]